MNILDTESCKCQNQHMHGINHTPPNRINAMLVWVVKNFEKVEWVIHSFKIVIGCYHVFSFQIGMMRFTYIRSFGLGIMLDKLHCR